MIPNWWQFTLLAIASFRITRLLGWDTFPLAVRLRQKLTGAEAWMNPNTEDDAPYTIYRRPGVEHFLSCPFCQGFWVSVCWVGAWWLWPHTALIVAVPFAISSIVGLIAKDLDP